MVGCGSMDIMRFGFKRVCWPLEAGHEERKAYVGHSEVGTPVGNLITT